MGSLAAKPFHCLKYSQVHSDNTVVFLIHLFFMYYSSACAETGYRVLVAIGTFCLVYPTHYGWIGWKQTRKRPERHHYDLPSPQLFPPAPLFIFCTYSAHVRLSFLVMCCHCVSAPLRKKGESEIVILQCNGKRSSTADKHRS